MITFEVTGPAGPVVLAELDGRYLSTEVAGGFTGRVIGMYVTQGSAAFDWFAYRPGSRAPDPAEVGPVGATRGPDGARTVDFPS